MVLFTILLLIALCLIAFVVFVTVVGGFIFTVVFGVVIVCVFIIGFILYQIIKRKRS